MNRLSPNILTGIFVTLFCALSFLIRAILPFDKIFTGGWIKFSSIDAYYHMYLVDNLARNFPHLTGFSPFFIYPDGGPVSGAHFYNWLLGGTAWVFGLGSPSQYTVDIVGVYFPAILGALVVIPVFFIGKALFNKWVGIIAAALIAIMPGEFLGRSILGFTDQHIAEVLFSVVAILFFILAIKQARKNELTLSSVIRCDWQVIRRPLIYALLSGLFLGIYLLTWQGGLLFVFIIVLYLVIQFIIDHLKHKSTEYLGLIGFVVFLIASVIFLPYSPSRDIFLAIIAALLVPPVFALISWFISRRKLKPVYFPAALILIGIVILVIFALASPGLFDTMMERFTIFNPGGASAETTIEMQSFFTYEGEFTIAKAWGNFTTGFFLTRDFYIPGFGIIAFVVLLWLYIRRRAEDNHWLLFLIWTLVVLVATIGQQRFAYYLAVNIALLTAYISWQIIWIAGLKKLVKSPESDNTPADKNGKNKPTKNRRRAYERGYRVAGVLVIAVIVLFLTFFWNVEKAVSQAKPALYAPSDGWQESLLWMRDNTPEPFGDPDAYYALYDNPPEGESFAYPESAYGVTSWWDYGYWITRTAQRIPNANPSQAAAPIKNVAAYLLSADVPHNRETLDIIHEFNTRYVMIDFAMTLSKFHAICSWADEPLDQYYEVYVVPYEGKLAFKIVYYPEYYRTTCVRLFHFNGEAVTDEKPVVIDYDEIRGDDGNIYKRITKIASFTSYEEAQEYLESEDVENRRLVGLYPFISPIPLEAMEDYRLVYTSEGQVAHYDLDLIPEVEPVRLLIPEVRIFEYLGN